MGCAAGREGCGVHAKSSMSTVRLAHTGARPTCLSSPVPIRMTAGSTTHFGGTMRLGARRTVLQTVDCISAKLYQSEQYVDERHRHRWVAAVAVGFIYKAGLRGVQSTAPRPALALDLGSVPQQQHRATHPAAPAVHATWCSCPCSHSPLQV
jgi:CTP synthase